MFSLLLVCMCLGAQCHCACVEVRGQLYRELLHYLPCFWGRVSLAMSSGQLTLRLLGDSSATTSNLAIGVLDFGDWTLHVRLHSKHFSPKRNLANFLENFPFLLIHFFLHFFPPSLPSFSSFLRSCYVVLAGLVLTG